MGPQGKHQPRFTQDKVIEYHYFDDEGDGMPIITLGTTEPEAIIVETGTLPDDFYSLQASDIEMQEPDTEQLEDNTNTNLNKSNKKRDENSTAAIKLRTDVPEFSSRSDGSVNCMLCGKIFASRQHWYRHKYRAHVVDPVPLNKCEKCHIFFKSRKGYLGHMSSKHNETLQDGTPVRNDQAAALANAQATKVIRPMITLKPKVPDPEMAIPNTILQNYLSVPAAAPSKKSSRTKSVDRRKAQSAPKALEVMGTKEYQERRVKDESFVMGIIEKVRRQCETEPEVANRRGYTRKPYFLRT